ncbi:MAG: alpha/beta hydrolase [Proteobacteria bacterium]|nr:MAG: alpha/beta hydrolase [Pseudomonadota bacterium]
MPQIEADGATLHYEMRGDGPAVVFVHGSGGSALSWWQQVPHFAQRHRVVAFDHRGFGRSACDGADALDPARFAGDLAAILDHAGIERAALVCQSMGGWTGLAFALAHPARSAALVLAGTPGGVATPRIAQDAAGVPQRIAERGFLGMALAPDFPQRDPMRAFLYEQIASLNPPATLPTLLPKLGALRVEPAQLADFAVPTLVTVGTEDSFFSVEGLREVAAAIPRARFHVFPGVGHSAYFEEPAAFNGIVDAFFEEIAPWRSSS